MRAGPRLVDAGEIVNAILRALRGGIAWRLLLSDFSP